MSKTDGPVSRGRNRGSQRVMWTDPATGKARWFVSARALQTYLLRIDRQAKQDKRDYDGKVKSAHDRKLLSRGKGPVLVGKVCPIERTW